MKKPSNIHVKATLKKIERKEYYRFIVDGQLHKPEDGQWGYFFREFYSLSSAYKAFKWVIEKAFDKSSDRKLTPEILISIHTIIAEHLKQTNKNFSSGEKRPVGHPGAFELTTDTSTLKGIKELITRIDDGFPGIISCPSNKPKKFYNSDDLKKWAASLKPTDLNAERLWEQIQKNSSSQDEQDAENNAVVYLAPPTEEIDKYLINLCDEYNNALDKLEKFSQYDVLKIIARTGQKIDQLHAFRDGNVRLTLFATHLMLMWNGMLPCILAEPNMFDAVDEETLVRSLLQGITNTQLLADEPQEELFEYITPPLSADDVYRKILTSGSFNDEESECVRGFETNLFLTKYALSCQNNLLLSTIIF